MVKEKILCGMICLLAMGVVEASAKAEATKEIGTQTEVQAIEPKLIMEYKFDEPIVDVIFDEATMTVKEARALGMKGLEKRKSAEKVKVQYPKVLVTEKAVKFLDEKGKGKKEISLKPFGYAVFSPSKKYIGIDKLLEEEEDGIVVEEISIIGDKEEAIWKLRYKYPPYYDGISEDIKTLYISNKGGAVVATSIGIFWVFDERGKLLKEIPLSKIPNFPLYFKAVFSENGEYFVGVPGGDIPEDTARLFLFDKDGNKLWEKYLEGIYDHYSEVKITKHGDFIIASKILYEKGGGFIDVFNKKGELVWEYQDPWGSGVFILSRDEQYLLGGCYDNRLVLFRLKDGEVLWTFSDTTRKVYFHLGPLVISPRSRYILAAGFANIENQCVYLLDFKGNLIWQGQVSGKGDFDYIKSLSFATNEKEFSFAISDKIYRYVIQEVR